MSTVCARASRTSSTGARQARCRLDPAPIQTRSWTSRFRSTKARASAGRGNGATAPGGKPVSRSTSPAPTICALRQPAAAASLARSARRSPGTSATTSPPSQSKTSVLTICSSGVPSAVAASSAEAVSPANSSIRASAPACRRYAETRATGSGHAALRATSSERDEADVVEALLVEAADELGGRFAVDRERHQRFPAAPGPGDRHVGDVDARVTEERADAPDDARDVVVAEEDHQRRELELELEAERAHEPVAVLAPPQRPPDAPPPPPPAGARPAEGRGSARGGG